MIYRRMQDHSAQPAERDSLRPLIQFRRPVKEAVHLALAAAALAAAFWLRFEFVLSANQKAMLLSALPVALVIKALVFRIFALRDVAWRNVGFADLTRLTGANVAAALAAALGLHWWIGNRLPRSIPVLDTVLCTAFMLMLHAGMRLRFAHRPRAHPDGRAARRVLIYGAGKAGQTVLAEIRSQAELRVTPVGFLDDDPAKQNLRLHGLRVWGGRAELAKVARRLAVDEIWLALANAQGPDLVDILTQCQAAHIATKRVPPLSELLQRKVLLPQVRELRIEDLLGRAPVKLEEETIRLQLAGETILVTGAGGSIGSEICRQMARFAPRAIVGLDQAETALFDIEGEMRTRFPDVRFHPEIADIQNRRRVEEVFNLHRPSLVYHAAAYKHVPMMEHHLFEAIENNILGTLNVVKAASRSAVEKFVLVSSDKAVRPANIMGATKRAAEIVCQAAATTSGKTRFLAVRFGNVLGSNGSVIPMFHRQIAAGGPVTVTHPEMRRYFMTIPEAAQLVLQASTLGQGGEIFVLEMGEPVKILDLARKLIMLTGLSPGVDIPIEFSGVRPGEKLFEELHSADELTLPTAHDQIRVYQSPPLPVSDVFEALLELKRKSALRDSPGVLLCLKELIPDYNPSAMILKQAFGPSRGTSASAARAS